MTSFWDAMEGHVVAGVCAYAGMALALLQVRLRRNQVGVIVL
jgi:hypothetical protein